MNPTDVPALPRRFLDRLRHALIETPKGPIIHYYASDQAIHTITVEQLFAKAFARVGRLRSKIEVDDLVLIIEHDPLDQVYWWLASVLAGGVPGILTPPTPKLDPTKYKNDLTQILSSYPALVVYGDGVFPDPPGNGCFLDARGQDLPFPIAQTWPERDPDLPFVFQQSSGTTGLRKGVPLSESVVVHHLESYGNAICVSEDDTVISWLPLYHDMGLVAVLLQALYRAIPLVLTSPLTWLVDPAWLIRAVERHRATLCWLPNFAFDLLASRVAPNTFEPGALRSLRMVVNCSEPVLPASLERFENAFRSAGLRPHTISSCYAMAENTFAATQTPPYQPVTIESIDWDATDTAGIVRPAAAGRKVAASGLPINGTEIKVVDTEGRACADGKVGEIVVRGASLMTGYVGIGADVKAIDADGWFHTGDIGYLRLGQLFVIGRRNDMIIRGGRNINPSYLEAAASNVRGIKPGRTVAFGNENQTEGTEDIIVIAERDSAMTVDDRWLRSEIVRVCIAETGITPQRVAIVDPPWLAKSSSGKIARASCRRKWLELNTASQ